jgi:Glycosyl hydrolases family 16
MTAEPEAPVCQALGVRSTNSTAPKDGYVLEFEDTFDGPVLDETRWFPYYLPQWSSRAAAAARHELGGGLLRLNIEANQQPWCPEFDDGIRVSSLQTGVFAGPVGSPVGQQRFSADLVVREAQRNMRLYTPQYGFFELRAKAIADPSSMVALWMIGYEDEPDRSAEICICELFGRDMTTSTAAVGMGLHPFGDPAIVDEFAAEVVAIDAREFHVYASEWTPESVSFFVDDRLIKTVAQSPRYPMQFMLGIYEFPDDRQARAHPYPKQFTIDYFRGYRPLSRQPAWVGL